jgi:hypothetical protein
MRKAKSSSKGFNDPLIFKIKDLLPLIEHAEKAPTQCVAFDHLLDPRFWKPGARPDSLGAVKADEVDVSRIEPSLALAKDHGAYLLSNGSPMQMDETTGKRRVVHARGCDPDIDKDYYDTTDAICGGDDFVELIGTKTLRRLMIKAPLAKELRIAFNDRNFMIEVR